MRSVFTLVQVSLSSVHCSQALYLCARNSGGKEKSEQSERDARAQGWEGLEGGGAFSDRIKIREIVVAL